MFSKFLPSQTWSNLLRKDVAVKGIVEQFREQGRRSRSTPFRMHETSRSYESLDRQKKDDIRMAAVNDTELVELLELIVRKGVSHSLCPLKTRSMKGRAR